MMMYTLCCRASYVSCASDYDCRDDASIIPPSLPAPQNQDDDQENEGDDVEMIDHRRTQAKSEENSGDAN